MDLFADLWLGFSTALSPINLLYLLIGTMIGMIVGIIPGFGPSAGIAILLPITFGMDPTGAVVMLAAQLTLQLEARTEGGSPLRNRSAPDVRTDRVAPPIVRGQVGHPIWRHGRDQCGGRNTDGLSSDGAIITNRAER